MCASERVAGVVIDGAIRDLTQIRRDRCRCSRELLYRTLEEPNIKVKSQSRFSAAEQ